MEFRVVPNGECRTAEQYQRFVRLAVALNIDVRPGRRYANGTGFTSGRLEMSNGPAAQRIIRWGLVDGFQIIPVPEDNQTPSGASDPNAIQ